MKKFKQFILCTSIAILSIASVGCSSSSAKDATQSEKITVPETAAARVGNEFVDESEVVSEMFQIEQFLIAQYGEDYKSNEEAMNLYNSQREQVLNYLIEVKLVMQDAKANKIKASNEAIEEQLAQTKAQFESEEAFTAAMEKEGVTLDEFKETIAQTVILTQAVEAITKKVEVTDADIEKYYNENSANYTKAPGANMAHILVPTEEEALKIKKEYDAGKSFEELAAQYGTDGTKDVGGSLGFVEYETQNYDADFLAGAKPLAEGEVSAPVKSQFGWHLIKVTGIQKESKVAPLEEVKDTIKEAVLKAKQGEAFTAYLEELKAKTTIEIYDKKEAAPAPAPKEDAAQTQEAAPQTQEAAPAAK